MPDIIDDVPRTPKPAALPAPLQPDPFEQRARTVAVDEGGPVKVLLIGDARAAADELVRHVTKRIMDQLEIGAGRLLEAAALMEVAESSLELWGAFDYELTLLAERYGLEYPPEASPLQLIEKIIDVATGRAAGVAVDEIMRPTIGVFVGEPGEVR